MDNMVIYMYIDQGRQIPRFKIVLGFMNPLFICVFPGSFSLQMTLRSSFSVLHLWLSVPVNKYGLLITETKCLEVYGNSLSGRLFRAVSYLSTMMWCKENGTQIRE